MNNETFCGTEVEVQYLETINDLKTVTGKVQGVVQYSDTDNFLALFTVEEGDILISMNTIVKMKILDYSDALYETKEEREVV